MGGHAPSWPLWGRSQLRSRRSATLQEAIKTADQIKGRTLTLTLSLTRQGRGERIQRSACHFLSPLPCRLGERIKVRGFRLSQFSERHFYRSLPRGGFGFSSGPIRVIRFMRDPATPTTFLDDP